MEEEEIIVNVNDEEVTPSIEEDNINVDVDIIPAVAENDPIFTQSAAYGIGSTDISNWNSKANTSDIPTKTSDLNNDSGFITNTVDNLTNYYLKTDTYTKTEVNNLIANINSFNVEVVESLPTENIDTHTIYLVPKESETNDNYDEYIYINNAWEHIGSTSVDLTNYYTKTQTDNLLVNKVDKVDGKSLSTNDYTSAEKTKLAGIEAGAEVNEVNSVNGSTGNVVLNIPTKTSDLTNDSGFINNSVNSLTNYYTKTQTDNTFQTIISSGIISMFAGITAPTGWLICDGSAVSRTTYASLFTAIGTTYGTGDGTTTFNLPNLKGKVPVGLDSEDTDFDTLGENGGSKELQAHSHTINSIAKSKSNVDPNFVINYQYTSETPIQFYTNTAGTGDSGNLQPYLVMNYIIKA